MGGNPTFWEWLSIPRRSCKNRLGHLCLHCCPGDADLLDMWQKILPAVTKCQPRGCWSFCNIVGSLPYDIEYHETAALAFSTPVQQNVDYSLLYVSNDIRVVDSICSFELKMLLWVCVKRGIDVTAFTFTDCRSLTLHASHCTDATSQHLENHKIPVNVI